MSAVLKAEEPSARYLATSRPPLVEHFDLVASASGGVARLRELILTLAVRGKLVPQDPKDEPAVRLLEKVRASRQHVLTAKGVGWQPKFESMTQEEQQFTAPDGWHWCRLCDVAWPQAGFAFKSAGFNQAGEGVPLIRIRDVGARTPPETFFAGDYRKEFLVERGDWLVSMDGEFRVCDWGGPQALLNQRVSRLVFFSNAVAADFVAFALQRELSRLQGTKAYTTVDHLSGKQIANAAIALPPASEQLRIVGRVEELMRLCDALEGKGRLEDAQHAQLLDTLLGTLTDSASSEDLAANWQRVAAHFEVLLDRPAAVDALEASFTGLALKGRLLGRPLDGQSAVDALTAMAAQVAKYRNEHRVPTSRIESIDLSSVPFELPRDWRWVRLDTICTVITDGDHLPPPKSETGVAFLTIGNISNGELSFAHCRFVPQEYFDRIAVYRRPAKGDLLYTVVGATYGRPVLVQSDQPFCVQRHIAILKPASAGLDVDFLSLVLKSSFAYEQATKGITGTAQPTIPLNALRNYLVPLPPLPEQHRIVARINELRRLCAGLRDKLASVQTTQVRLADALVESAGSAD